MSLGWMVRRFKVMMVQSLGSQCDDDSKAVSQHGDGPKAGSQHGDGPKVGSQCDGGPFGSDLFSEFYTAMKGVCGFGGLVHPG